MKIFSLTKLGRKVASNHVGENEEGRVLRYLSENKTASDSELEVVGGEGWLVRRLVKSGLVKELTL